MRRSQAAVEYLMMIGIVLLIIFLAMRLIQRTVNNASKNIENATQLILKELQKGINGSGG
ncbi:hypothetical protein [Thermococcus sp.]|uniref:hypothetical protein n=1 Tax=Thermococcus sp. TaxID=35749 RepID=UPI0025E7123A|nr:hypothetical protein [Thermococcus sp.]